MPSPATLLLLLAAQQTPVTPPKTFEGRAITLTLPKTDEQGFFTPTSRSKICLQAPPSRQCYIPPKDFGLSADIRIITVTSRVAALFITVATRGVSGYSLHLALLRPDDGSDRLKNLFADTIEISNQGEHEFWTDSSISPSPIFLTADYVDNGDCHYCPHRYLISSYVYRSSPLLENKYYFLYDRYMTTRFYPDGPRHILATEKPEIHRRLLEVNKQLGPPRRQ